MDKTLRAVIIACVCVVAFSVFYYFVVFLPSEKRAERAEAIRKEQAIEQQQIQKRVDYKACLENVYMAYSYEWERACEQLEKPADCRLPSSVVDRLDGRLRASQDRCLKEHLQTK